MGNRDGKGVDRSVNYLEHVLLIHVTTHPAWSHLKDLQSLRNILVHRSGKPGESQEVRSLITRCPQALELRKADGLREQIWMSMNLCRDFVEDIGGFFERVFKACGCRTGICNSTAERSRQARNCDHMQGIEARNLEAKPYGLIS